MLGARARIATTISLALPTQQTTASDRISQLPATRQDSKVTVVVVILATVSELLIYIWSCDFVVCKTKVLRYYNADYVQVKSVSA